MESSLIWKKLNFQNNRIVTSLEIKGLAKEIGNNEERAIAYLQEEGYIVRILRGIFYVRTPDEKMRKGLDRSLFELVGMAIGKKGVKEWYFGLDTALRLNGMTHEYHDITHVLTDSFRTTKPIMIDGSRFSFVRRNKRFFGFGMKEEKNYHYSDPERTILDIAYYAYLHGKNIKEVREPMVDYEVTLDKGRFSEYLRHYPRRFIKALGKIDPGGER
jgi:predicted transcriptional regulator of viral defense system